MSLRAMDSCMLSGVVYVDNSFANECYFIYNPYIFIQNYVILNTCFQKMDMCSDLSCRLGVVRRKMNYNVHLGLGAL